MVYEESAILDVCGYQVGDNLALLTTAEQEDALESQLPYIEEAQVIRHFPNTLEIHVTAAQKAACVQSGSQWFNVSYSGKILESVAAPEDGVLQVTGLTLTDPAPGAQLQAQDEDYQSAYDTIFAVLEQRGAAGDFVSLDLTDLYNITMNYQDRIRFQLGSTVELAYKINYGLDLVTGRENQEYIGSDETGTLDLSLAGDTKQAYFTEEVLSSSSTSESGDTGAIPAAVRIPPPGRTPPSPLGRVPAAPARTAAPPAGRRAPPRRAAPPPRATGATISPAISSQDRVPKALVFCPARARQLWIFPRPAGEWKSFAFTAAFFKNFLEIFPKK